LYEIIPAGVNTHLPAIDPLKYQVRSVKGNRTIGNELCTVKFRYKKPDAEQSRLIEKIVNSSVSGKASKNFTFSAAVAGFGMLLRDSEFKGDLTYEQVTALARESRGADANGYRSECIKMMEQAALLSSRLTHLNNRQ
jgi:Ca-activated chloride channel family protein